MALADPDPPADLVVPDLAAAAPGGLEADRYGRLRAVYYELPRRSRVVLVLRLRLPGRQPLTLRAIGALFGVGEERARQLEQHAVWGLVRAWQPSALPADLTLHERTALLAPAVGAAIDRYPLEQDPEG